MTSHTDPIPKNVIARLRERGLRAVPEVPTREMLDAALLLHFGEATPELRRTWDQAIRARWVAMLRASP